jgi:hypothetical protein
MVSKGRLDRGELMVDMEQAARAPPQQIAAETGAAARNLLHAGRDQQRCIIWIKLHHGAETKVKVP